MSHFFYNINDPHDTVGAIVTNPTQTAQLDVCAAHDFSQSLRGYHWDNRRITSHGTYYGDPNYQWLAHIPARIAELLDMRHPGWDTDENTMREILKLYPECNVLPEETRG